MELTLLQRAEEAERATEANEFRIISEAALAIFGWQDERYKRVLRMLEAGASLDAALTLVPEGWDWVINSDGACTLEHPDHAVPLVEAFAATPALALCAAALRARASIQKEDGDVAAASPNPSPESKA